MTGILTRRDPTVQRGWFRRGPFASIREDLRDLVSDLFEQDMGQGALARMPALFDLSETNQHVEVRMDVPGMKTEDIEVKLGGGLLTVSGQRREEQEQKGRTFHRVERRVGSFSRTITLPCPVNEENVEARYRDGVLTVTMRKSEESKPRKISVKA